MSGMAGSIVAGGVTYSFHIWKGQVKPLQPIADIYARLGQVGEGSQILGYTAPPSHVRAIYLTFSMTDALAFRTSVMQLAGSYGNISEPSGAGWTGALIAAVMGDVRGGIHNYAGTAYPFRVDFDLIIKVQQ